MAYSKSNRNEFKIATFNALNLVLPNYKYYDNRVYTESEFAQKKMWINNQLTNMRADIVGFQEIFHQEALMEILSDNPFYKGKTQLVVANSDGTKPTVGLISKFPILDYAIIEDLPKKLTLENGVEIPFEKFSRPVLKARIRLNEQSDLIVFVAHLKSKRPIFAEGADQDDPIEKARAEASSLMLRTAEAYGLRMLMMAELQNRDAPVVLMGDFNDTHTAVTTRLLSGEPPFRYLPLDKKMRQWDVLLYHVKDIQARLSYADTYYTHIHNGHHESLDHIMVSQELVNENPQRIGRVGYVRVFNDHLIDSTLSNDRLPSWQSDHAQVVASIEMRNPIVRLGEE